MDRELERLKRENSDLLKEVARLRTEISDLKIATRRLRGYKIDPTKIRSLHAQGMTDDEIAKRFGASGVAVLRWRRLFGLDANGIKRRKDADRG